MSLSYDTLNTPLWQEKFIQYLVSRSNALL